MGEEKLDNAVYTIRGYADLADMARARGDRATAELGHRAGRRGCSTQFEDAWWYGGDGASPTPTRSTTRAT